MMYIFLAVISLILISCANAASFKVLCGGIFSWRESYRVATASSALNKLLFSGTGFLAGGYFAKKKDFSFYQIVGVFLVLELLSVVPWLGIGLFFGAELASKNILMMSVTVLILLVFIFVKRDKLSNTWKELWTYIRSLYGRVPGALPFVVLSLLFYFLYYSCLFRAFGFNYDIMGTIRIVGISFALGYLSPAPAGVGFKDGGLVLLLVDDGVDISSAVYFAACDRMIVTLVWACLGAVFSYDLIASQLRKRFQLKRS